MRARGLVPPSERGAGRRSASPSLTLPLLLGAAALLLMFTFTVRLPRHKLLLEEEIEELVASRLHGLGHGSAAQPCNCSTAAAVAGAGEGPGGAPRYCRLGLPPGQAAPGEQQQQQQQGDQVDPDGSGEGSSDGGAAQQQAAAAGQQQAAAAGQEQQQHRLAVLVPYRDREQHLANLLGTLRPYLDKQGRAHDVFVVEQADSLLFNRGALLNAAALLLQGSSYDHYCFQDVDTVPLEKGNIQYSYPAGDAPLHLTPHWLHPKSTFEDFFGGLLIITAEQFGRLNGFGTHFWGWGREDDNLRHRLVRAGMWPPEYPDLPRKATRTSKRSYFAHQKHAQAVELRAAESEDGKVQYFQENPRLPYQGAKIMSSQPQFLQDTTTGLNSTMFQVLSIQPYLNATRISLRLHCDTAATPWCEPAAIGSRRTGEVRHAAAVHAVVGS